MPTMEADTLTPLAFGPLGWTFAAIWGALWGSFFNVCIHRIGLYESVTRPRSRCPSCGRTIAAYDNLPIVSWLALRGRCRRCGARISLRYPLVEALGLALAVGLWWRFVAGGDGVLMARLARFFVYFYFCGALVVLSGIDLEHKLIPDRVTYPAIPLFFVCALVLRDVAPFDLVLGAVIGYGVVALTAEAAYRILGREGMGYGDAKLLMMVGALLGWRAVAFTFFAAPFFGLVVLPTVFVLRRKKMLGVEVPYGPFLAGAALLYLLFAKDFVARFL
jgi:leader peptidase (prepilin peptidase) / N-methyltransferase